MSTEATGVEMEMERETGTMVREVLSLVSWWCSRCIEREREIDDADVLV